jgi:hypothetical protein
MPDVLDRERLFDHLFKHGEWRTEVEVRRRELAQRLEIAKADTGGVTTGGFDETIEAIVGNIDVKIELQQPATQPQSPDVRAKHVAAVNDALSDAQLAIESGASLRAWWTGSAITMAWESVHDAEGELVRIESDDVVRSTLPRLLSWIDEVVPDKALKDRYDKQLGNYIEGKARIDRTVVRQAHQTATGANNERHASLRTFRNVVLGVSFGLAALLLALAVWHAANRHFISLCGTEKGKQVCLSGAASTGRDVAEILLVGAVAGLLSVAFGLGSETTAPSRYNVRAAQATLKPVAGAATALIGVFLVQSHILLEPAGTPSEALFLAYAAIFGFSQQLLTQFVDKRAGKLLDPSSRS